MPSGGGVVKASQTWRLALGFLLAAALLVLFFRGVDLSALGSAFRSANAGWLVAAVLASIGTNVLRAWRLGYLLAPLAHVPFGRLVSATFVGFMSGLIVPRASEVLRPYLAGRRHGVPLSAGFATIVIERLMDVITVVGLVGLYLYVLPLPAQQTRGTLLDALQTGGGLAALGAVVLLLVLLAFHVHAERALAAIARLLRFLPEKLSRPMNDALRAFGGGLAVLRAPASHLAAILGQSLLVWLTIAATIHSTNLGFGLKLPFHSTFLMIGFLTVGVAIPTPGMVGGFHEFYREALTQGYGTDNATAVAAAIACHALSNLPVLVLGVCFLWREGLTMGKVAEVAEEAGEEPPANLPADSPDDPPKRVAILGEQP